MLSSIWKKWRNHLDMTELEPASLQSYSLKSMVHKMSTRIRLRRKTKSYYVTFILLYYPEQIQIISKSFQMTPSRVYSVVSFSLPRTRRSEASHGVTKKRTRKQTRSKYY